MKKIIHLSDLHSGGGGSLGRQPEAVVDALIEEYRESTGEFVVVVTGISFSRPHWRITPCMAPCSSSSPG